MSKILVTGAAGFIGSAVARRLIVDGNDVWSIDNLSTGKIENIPPNCKMIQGETYDSNVISELYNQMGNIDAIVHIAGQSSGEISFENPEYDLSTNALSTLKLLELAKKAGCNTFVYASSMCVYGDVEDRPINEGYLTVPKSCYSVGKLASENYMRIYSSFGIRCTALRFFNVYGPGQNLDNMKQGMISIYLAQALKNKHIIVKGDKNRFRDFVHVDDVVNSVIMSMIRNDDKLFDIYNVCTGVKTTVEQVIKTIIETLNDASITVKYEGGTPGDQFGIYGDYNKIKQILGWEPNIQFDEGIEQMIQWAKSITEE